MTATTALLATRDDSLVEEVLRCAAASGVEIDLVPDVAAALVRWAAVDAVLVGSDLCEAVAAHRPSRRSDVVVVASGVADERVFRHALEVGAAHVAELPAAGAWITDYLGDVADLGSGAGELWAFVGASGGVGATTLACAVAAVAAQTRRAALVDLDPWGAGVERVLGDDGVGGAQDLTWRDLHTAPGRLSARSLRDALPSVHGVGVLGFGAEDLQPDRQVAGEALSAARRGHGLVVADLPRYPCEGAAEAMLTAQRVVLVVAASVAGVAAARRVLGRYERAEPPQLVVRLGRHSPGAHDVASALGLDGPVALAEDRALDEQLGLGLGPVARRRSPVRRAARELLGRLEGGR